MTTSSQSSRTCSIWTAPPNAKFEGLEILRHRSLTREQIRAARESVSVAIRERQRPYETPVSAHTMFLLLP